jgi:outer membrane protein OmpA-like peptidoglycan-associated protein
MWRWLLPASCFLLATAADLPGNEPPSCDASGLVFFKAGSARVDERAAAILDNLLWILQHSDAPSRMTLIGFADRVGSEASNMRLSQRRASAVRDYLVSKGVARSLIHVGARGETNGLVDTPDGVADPNNRRVELIETPDPKEQKRRRDWWETPGRRRIVC